MQTLICIIYTSKPQSDSNPEWIMSDHIGWQGFENAILTIDRNSNTWAIANEATFVEGILHDFSVHENLIHGPTKIAVVELGSPSRMIMFLNRLSEELSKLPLLWEVPAIDSPLAAEDVLAYNQIALPAGS